MNSLMKGNHTLKKFFIDSSDALFGRTIDDILRNNFFDSFDANVREEQDAYKIEIAVPGMTRHDITIRVDGRVMWVSAQRQEKNSSWRTMEFSTKHLQRSFALPADADANNIKAKCRNGLLAIRIGKVRQTGSHRIIQVDGEESRAVLNDKLTSWWTRLVDKANRMRTKKRS